MKTNNQIETQNVRIATGLALKQIRNDLRITQRDIANMLNCSAADITQYETKGIDSIAVIICLCNVLEIDLIDFFLMIDQNMPNQTSLKDREDIKSFIEKNVINICRRERIRADITVKIKS